MTSAIQPLEPKELENCAPPVSCEHAQPLAREQFHFDLLSSPLDNTRFSFLLRAAPWKVAGFAIVAYYVAPLVSAAATGVLFSPPSSSDQFELLGQRGLMLWLSRSHSMRHETIAGHPTVYYANDPIHASMALVTAFFGTALILTALQGFPSVLAYLVGSGQMEITNDEIRSAIARAQRRRTRVTPYFAILSASALLTTFIVAKAFEAAHLSWWGHSAHGPAGIIFALAAGGMVFFGAIAVYLLFVGLQLVSELFAYPVVLRPFHPDGCNGFAVFGDFLILLFFSSLTIAAAISITFLGGYLGVERFLGTWLVGVGVLAMVPLILISPLIRCTVQIGRAKQVRLARVEAILNRTLAAIEDSLSENTDPLELKARVDHLLQTRNTMASLYGPYNFPFKPRVVGAVSFTYLLQVAVLAREAFERFG